ncbi:MAG TPA: L-lactate permease [Aliidongia sp.]|nr:L-lactate permease [Aliidongia sp.]
MPALIAAAPLLAVIALIASRRLGVLPSGLIGWALAVAAAAWLQPAGTGIIGFTVGESLKGAWIAWQAIAVTVAGLFFYRAIGRVVAGPGAVEGFSHRQLWAICFLIGPFTESATGFGVGCVIALSALFRMGLGGVPAVALALYSQILVPWGALAVGTLVGAGLIGLGETELALASAYLTAPLLAGYLLLYWRFARKAGHPVPTRQKLDDAAWTLLLAAALIIATREVAAELGCIASAGTLIVVRYLRDRRPDAAAFAGTARLVAPYAVLSLTLIATRTMPPLTHALKSMLVLAPYDGLPSFALLYNPCLWLIGTALVFLIAEGRAGLLGTHLRETALAAWRPVLVTLLFLAMTQILTAAGGAQLIGTALKAALGPETLLAAPVLGAVGGFLTGSNVSAAGMMMSVQAAMGTGAVLWPATLQNVAASNFSLLSPIRVAMGAALSGMAEEAVYKAIWPIGAMLLLLLVAEAAFLLFL